jgi:hypothetical protein
VTTGRSAWVVVVVVVREVRGGLGRGGRAGGWKGEGGDRDERKGGDYTELLNVGLSCGDMAEVEKMRFRMLLGIWGGASVDRPG